MNEIYRKKINEADVLLNFVLTNEATINDEMAAKLIGCSVFEAECLLKHLVDIGIFWLDDKGFGSYFLAERHSYLFTKHIVSDSCRIKYQLLDKISTLEYIKNNFFKDDSNSRLCIEDVLSDYFDRLIDFDFTKQCHTQ